MGQAGTHKVIFSDRVRPEDSFDVTGPVSEDEARAVARERSGAADELGSYRVVPVASPPANDSATVR